MDISKNCTDFLRTYIAETYAEKLKASHAREIVAAFFGFKTHAAQIAEVTFPINELESASIMMPDVSLLSDRLDQLTNLPPKLPSAEIFSNILSTFVKNEQLFLGQVWQPNEFHDCIHELLHENDGYITDEIASEIAGTNACYGDFPEYGEPVIRLESDKVTVYTRGVLIGTPDQDRPYSGHEIELMVTITLYRVAGRTCFEEPEIDVGGEIGDGYYASNVIDMSSRLEITLPTDTPAPSD